jgi:hypothetical protein
MASSNSSSSKPQRLLADYFSIGNFRHLAKLVHAQPDAVHTHPITAEEGQALHTVVETGNVLSLFNNILGSIDASIANWNDEYGRCLQENSLIAQQRDQAFAREATALEQKAAALELRDTYKQLLEDKQDVPSSSKNDCIVKDPPAFSGEGKDTREIQATFQHWRSQIMMRWNLQPKRYTSERLKQAHIMGLLSGTAWKLRSWVQDRLAEGTGDTDLPFPTGKALLAELAISYVLHDLTTDAKTKIISMTQGDEPFASFLADYNTTADQAGWTAEQKIDGLKFRVHNAIQDLHKNNIIDPEKSDWEAWARLYMKYAAKIEETRALKKARSQKSSKPQHNHQQQGSESQRKANPTDPDAMDVDQVQLNRLDPAELQRRIDLNLCKRCGQPGHYANNCDGNGNVVPTRSFTRGRSGFRGWGPVRGGRGVYPQQQQPGQQRPPAQQLRVADVCYYPASSLTLPPATSSGHGTPQPIVHQPTPVTPPTHVQPGHVYGTLDEMPPDQRSAFEGRGKA